MGFPLLVCILPLRNIQVTKMCLNVLKCLLSLQLYCHYVKRIILRYFLTMSPPLLSKSCSSLWLQLPTLWDYRHASSCHTDNLSFTIVKKYSSPNSLKNVIFMKQKTPKFITIELPIVIENNSKCRIFRWDTALKINNVVFTQLLT